MCQISVWNLSVTKFCQKYVRSNLEMSLKCIRCHKCVRKLSVVNLENCQNCVRNDPTDSYQTHFWTNRETFSGNICLQKLSENCQIFWSDTFLTVFAWKCFQKMFLHFIRNVSDNCQLMRSDTILIFFLYNVFSENVLWHLQKCVGNLSVEIFMTVFWQISLSDTALTVF